MQKNIPPPATYKIRIQHGSVHAVKSTAEISYGSYLVSALAGLVFPFPIRQLAKEQPRAVCFRGALLEPAGGEIL